MVGKGVQGYGLVCILTLIFVIFIITIPAYAASIDITFDQPEIPRGHSDVITIIESTSTILSEEDFENGFDKWVNTQGVDDNDCWWINQGSTGSAPSTGPSGGANGSMKYVYYEASNGMCPSPVPGDQAFLVGPTIDFTAYNNVQLVFSRHMLDATIPVDEMGKLALQIQTQPGSTTFVDIPDGTIEGHQSDQWEVITVDLSGPSYDNSGSRQLRFVATELVTGFRSDMAVDEITITGDRTIPPPIDIAIEDFESGFDTWVNTQFDDDTNDCWWINQGSTGSAPSTGPSSAASGSNYVFYESSNSMCSPTTSPPQNAFLVGPIINFTKYNNVQLEFSRHMHGAQMGELALQIETSLGSDQFEDVQDPDGKIEGDQGNLWEVITIDLSHYDNSGPRQLRFVATELTPGFRSDMAVDKITIRGVPTAIIVTVGAIDAAGDFLREPIDVPLAKRDSNTYWQLVEFGDTTDELKRQLEVNFGDTVQVNFTELYTERAEIVDPDAGTLITSKSKLNVSPAFCNADNDAVPGPDLGGDIDEDGVCDNWEIDPATGPMIIEFPPHNRYIMDTTVCNSFLQPDPANPVKCYGTDQRDIYVEIDYMVGHKPNIEALYEVIETFANAPSSTNPNVKDPIRLHIQLVTNSTGPIPHQDCTKFPGSNAVPGFDQIRQVYYGTEYEHAQIQPPTPSPPPVPPLQYDWGFLQKKQIFHYGLFVHSQCQSDSSGVGEYRGNDLMVSLGPFTGGIGNPDQQAGTFLHELGHNLNITHGGSESEKNSNCKPNYLSVMSYSRQFPIQYANRSLDFSREALGGHTASGVSLNEHELSESQGMDTYNHNPNEGVIFGPIPPLFPPPTHGSIDWNQNGEPDEPGISATNLNGIPGIGGCGNNTNTDLLMGYNDWDRNLMNLTSRDSNGWADGRSIMAGFSPAVWEDGDSIFPSVLSPTCPSLKQIMDWADPNVLGNASDPSLPDHKLAKAKLKAHLNNYRMCAGGAGESDILKLKADYAVSLLYSLDHIVTFYTEDPSKRIDDFLKHYDTSPSGILEQILEFISTKSLDKVGQEKLQFHYTIVDTILVEHGNTIEPHYKNKLQEIKSVIEDKASFFNVTLNQKSIEEILEVQPIFAQDELTSSSVKNMTALRADSMLEYIKNLNQSHFYEPKNLVINTYYEPEFAKIKNHTQHDNYAEAAMAMINLDHADKIQNIVTLQKLEFATDTIVDQYTRAIPEFGTIASLILVAAITSIIILTTKTRNIFMPQNYQ